MKRLGKFTLLIAFGIMISLTACGSKDDGEEINEQSTEVEEAIEDETSTEDEASAKKSQVFYELSDFEAETLGGGVFTKDDFSKYDLTMVNIWTSWCGPCVAEMPDLQELKENLPENMNIITINADAIESGEISKKILEDVNATFDTLIPEDIISSEILSNIQAYPTTIFVNRDGNLVGGVKEGAPSSDAAEVYFEIMEEILKGLK